MMVIFRPLFAACYTKFKMWRALEVKTYASIWISFEACIIISSITGSVPLMLCFINSEPVPRISTFVKENSPRVYSCPATYFCDRRMFQRAKGTRNMPLRYKTRFGRSGFCREGLLSNYLIVQILFRECLGNMEQVQLDHQECLRFQVVWRIAKCLLSLCLACF